jgi:hypothetical protein
LCTSPTSNYEDGSCKRPSDWPTNQPNEHVRGLILVRQCVGNRYEGLSLLRFAALRQGNYATIDNYLKGELRYMDAGE